VLEIETIIVHKEIRSGTLTEVGQGVPDLLEKLRGGDESVLNELVAVLYDELRRIAGRHLRGERRAHTLQPTALVAEAYLKLAGEGEQQFTDRVHFLAVASRVMRQVLIDYARGRAAKKRLGGEAGGGRKVMLTTRAHPETAEDVGDVDLLDLDRALEELSAEDPGLARVIEMGYFGGMTAEETAGALKQSVHVVRHDLRLAQAWLRRKLSR
jgi:RNA polymerase sigma factor (TIGR02999 family)